MKRLNGAAWIGSAGLLVLILLVAGCAAGTSLKNLPAVQPVETLPENVVLEEPNSAEFKIRPPTGRVLSMTKDNITVQIVYWRRADLDRKYNRGNAFSPFYETEALHQGDKTDVFYVKVTNNAATPVVYRIKGTRQVPCEMIDQGGKPLRVIRLRCPKRTLDLHVSRFGDICHERTQKGERDFDRNTTSRHRKGDPARREH